VASVAELIGGLRDEWAAIDRASAELLISGPRTLWRAALYVCDKRRGYRRQDCAVFLSWIALELCVMLVQVKQPGETRFEDPDDVAAAP